MMAGYQYSAHLTWIMSDEGQRATIAALIRALRFDSSAGAFVETAITSGLSSDSWNMLAIVDRLVGLGYIRRVDAEATRPGYYRVLTGVR